MGMKRAFSKLATSKRFHKTVVGSHAAYFGLGAVGVPGYKVVMAFRSRDFWFNVGLAASRRLVCVAGDLRQPKRRGSESPCSPGVPFRVGEFVACRGRAWRLVIA